MRQYVLASIGAAIIGLGLSSCSKSPKITGSVSGEPGSALPGTGELPPKSIEYFKEFVYEPIIGTSGTDGFCNRCHHAEEHHKTLEESHEYFLASDRVVWNKLEASVTVDRVAKGHNCWTDCVADAKALQAGLQEWLNKLEEDGFQIPEQEFGAKAGAVVPFIQATPHTLQLDPAMYMGGPITGATTANTWTAMQTGGNDGPLDTYVAAPAGGQARNANDAAAGTAAFNINVPAAGEYFVWARVMLPDEDSNQFFLNDGANTVPFIGDPTADTWGWQLLQTDADEPEPLPIQLQAGAQTITMREAEGGARLSYLVVTPRMDINLEVITVNLYDIEVDISDVAGTKASIVATIWEKAQEEDQTKTIGVTGLSLKSDKPLAIKGIYPLVNGRFEANQGIYKVVDGTFGGTAEPDLIETGGATGTTWLASFKQGTLGFAFDAISVAQ